MAEAARTPLQSSLIDIAVERKLLTPRQAEQCKDVAKKAKSIGLETPPEEVAVKQGLLVPEQLEELRGLAQLSDRGTSFGGYRLGRLIGEGGMGKVYEAMHEMTNRTVALKVMSDAQARDRTAVERFMQEIKALAKLQHKNIVAIYDAGRVGRRYYFSMELVDGWSLRRYVDDKKTLSEKVALNIIRQTLEALAHAHGLQIIHRDVKPENILLSQDGNPKLTDFGLVMHQDEDHKSLTQTGLMIGSYYYVAPEQLDGARDVDGRCDIYSVGATLYYALTGQSAYAGKTPQEVVAKTLAGDWVSPRRYNPDISSSTVRLIRKMMERNRDRRFRTAEQAIAEIDSLLKPRNWGRGVALIGCVGLALIGLGMLLEYLLQVFGK